MTASGQPGYGGLRKALRGGAPSPSLEPRALWLGLCEATVHRSHSPENGGRRQRLQPVVALMVPLG